MNQRNFILQLMLVSIALFEAVISADEITTDSLDIEEPTTFFFRHNMNDVTTTKEDTTQEKSKEEVSSQTESVREFESTVAIQPSEYLFNQTDNSTVSTVTATVSEYNTKTEKPVTVQTDVTSSQDVFTMRVESEPELDPFKVDIDTNLTVETNTEKEGVSQTTPTVTALPSEDKTTLKPPEVITESVKMETTTAIDELQQSQTDNSTFPTEGRNISENPVEKRIEEVINSVPKLSELILPLNDSRLTFHKDPEEALLDERITQIARQLAETSLRREYEEQKLGHFIPISVRPIESSPSTFLSIKKSNKFLRNSNDRTPRNDLKHVGMLAEIKTVPLFIYKKSSLPKMSPAQQRLPGVSKQVLNKDDFETVTNLQELLKTNRSHSQIEEINKILHLDGNNVNFMYREGKDQRLTTPFHLPTLKQFLSTQRQTVPGNYISEKKLKPKLHAGP